MVRLPKVLDRQHNQNLFVGRCSFGLNCLLVRLSNACRAPVEKGGSESKHGMIVVKNCSRQWEFFVARGLDCILVGGAVRCMQDTSRGGFWIVWSFTWGSGWAAIRFCLVIWVHQLLPCKCGKAWKCSRSRNQSLYVGSYCKSFQPRIYCFSARQISSCCPSLKTCRVRKFERTSAPLQAENWQGVFLCCGIPVSVLPGGRHAAVLGQVGSKNSFAWFWSNRQWLDIDFALRLAEGKFFDCIGCKVAYVRAIQDLSAVAGPVSEQVCGRIV